MAKIHRRIVIEIESNRVIERDCYEHDGPIALCKGGGGGSSTTQASIPKELKPLYTQTAGEIMDLQPQIAGEFDQFFGNQTQQIPGLTQGQQDIGAFQRMRAFDPNILNTSEQAAQRQLLDLINSPVGSAPGTIASMKAARDPALNDLAMAGLGNSDAVGTSLVGAYAPFLMQEQQLRAQAIPQLQNLGATEANRQSQYLSEYGTTEEKARGIEEARGQATLADLLRRQGLGSQFTTGILSGMPSITGSTTTSKQSGK